MLDLNQLIAQARKRLAEHINRSTGQHLRAVRKATKPKPKPEKS